MPIKRFGANDPAGALDGTEHIPLQLGAGADFRTNAEAIFTRGSSLLSATVQSLLGAANAAAGRAALGVATAGTLAFDIDGTLAANSDSFVPTQKAVKTYVDGIIAAQDAMVFKGIIDCSANPNYPAADCGHTYRVSVAGKIGGGAGPNVEIGDIVICQTDGTLAGNHAAVGAAWGIIQVNIDGALTTAAIGVSVQAFHAQLASISALSFGGNALKVVRLNAAETGFELATVSGSSAPFDDATAIVKGSADATKLLRFEVDGFTTATTRVITPPNADFTMAGINIAQTFTATQTFTPAANWSAIVMTGASLTGSDATSFLSFSGTFNTSGTPTFFKINLTDTTSNAASLLMDWQVGSASRFTASKSGQFRTLNAVGGGVGLDAAASESFTGWFQRSSSSMRVLNDDRTLWIPFSALSVYIASTGTFGFGSSYVPETQDGALSRVGAGIIGCGTGAAGAVDGTFAASNYRVASRLAVSGTAPTIASGFGTSPSISTSNGTAAFTLTIGTATTGVTTGTLAMPAATTGWVVTCQNVTNPDSFIVSQTGGTTTTVVLKNYSRTTGLATDFTASDVIRIKAMAY